MAIPTPSSANKQIPHAFTILLYPDKTLILLLSPVFPCFLIFILVSKMFASFSLFPFFCYFKNNLACRYYILFQPKKLNEESLLGAIKTLLDDKSLSHIKYHKAVKYLRYQYLDFQKK